MSSGPTPHARPSLAWRILSVPIYVKIMGIGLLVTILFGGITLYALRRSMCRSLYLSLEKRTHSLAMSLAAQVERPVLTGDVVSVMQRLKAATGAFPEVEYVLVRGRDGAILAHTFPSRVPRSVAIAFGDALEFRVLDAGDRFLFSRTEPILEGEAGQVCLAMTDRRVRAELAGFTDTLLWSLALCVVVGQGLALVLTRILTRPIHHLVETTDRVQHRDFEVEARIYSADEIGRLAGAFNRMVSRLREYRDVVERRAEASRSLIQSTVMAQEGERKRISRELHDQVGQSLSAMLLALDSCERFRSRELVAGEGEARACDEVKRMLSRLIDDVRVIAWDLRPPILDDYGVGRALQRLCGDLSQRSGLSIDHQEIVEADRRPSDKIEVTLYRIAQESLTNAIRHGNARHISVVLHRRASDVMLLVEDDGVGFDVSATFRNGGRGCLGLTGMKERATLLSGVLTIESSPGGGTVVRITAPVAGV